MLTALRALVVLTLAVTTIPAQGPIKAEAPIDYLPLAIYRSHWEADKISGRMFPWFGKRVAMVTTHLDGLDEAAMGRFIHVLDRAWALYAQLHPGHLPNDNWNLRDLPVVAAIPDTDPMLTCDLWCGRVGCNGLEVIGFYEEHYPEFLADEKKFSLDFLEGLGTNFFPYGAKHGMFDIGHARYLGYIAFKKFKLEDLNNQREGFVRDMEQTYSESSVSFFTALTGSKEKRLATGFDNRKVPYSGPDSVYASIMLKLRREYGGDRFHRRFYTAMKSMPDGNARNADGQHVQVVNWAKSICIAAERDLCPMLIKRWRFPLTEEDVKAVQAALKEAKKAGSASSTVGG